MLVQRLRCRAGQVLVPTRCVVLVQVQVLATVPTKCMALLSCWWCVVVQERRSAMGKGRHRLARLHALGACRAAGAPAAPPGAPAAGGALGAGGAAGAAGAVLLLVLLRVCCRGRCTLNVYRVKSAVSTRGEMRDLTPAIGGSQKRFPPAPAMREGCCCAGARSCRRAQE